MPIPAAAQGQGQSGGGATFDGTFNLRSFVSQGGAVYAVGTLVGTLTDTATGVVTSLVRNVRLPVLVQNATCDILLLDLGPLSLDLLGLQIDLSRVVLEITAEQGPATCSAICCARSPGFFTTPRGSRTC